jgi:Threonine synthase
MSDEFDIDLKYQGMQKSSSINEWGSAIPPSKKNEGGFQGSSSPSPHNTYAPAAIDRQRAGMQQLVNIPEGKIAQHKAQQALMHGAQTLQIQGNVIRPRERVQEIIHGR